MSAEHFLPYIKSTQSPEVYRACAEMLQRHPQADPFAVLHSVTTRTPQHRADVQVAKALAAKPITTTFKRKPVAAERREA